MKLKIKKLHPAAKVPTFGSDGAACFDLYALAVDGMESIGTNVSSSEPVICRTGLSFEVPAGYAMMVYSRSGHGFNHGVRLANCVGVIDSDYRGEVMVKLVQDEEMCEEHFFDLRMTFIKPGDRIAQAMLIPVPSVEFEVVDELSDTARGAGGMGSTGK